MTKKLSISFIKLFAETNGGILLSSVYVNARTMLQWSCKKGHEWDATYETMKRRVKKGNWCSDCDGMKKVVTYRDCLNLAKERRGKLLSKTYISTAELMEWGCEIGPQMENIVIKIFYYK